MRRKSPVRNLQGLLVEHNQRTKRVWSTGDLKPNEYIMLYLSFVHKMVNEEKRESADVSSYILFTHPIDICDVCFYSTVFLSFVSLSVRSVFFSALLCFCSVFVYPYYMLCLRMSDQSYIYICRLSPFSSGERMLSSRHFCVCLSIFSVSFCLLLLLLPYTVILLQEEKCA